MSLEAAIYDLHTRLLPYRRTLLLLGAALYIAYAWPTVPWTTAWALAGIVWLVFLGLRLIGQRIVGDGDAVLFAAFAAILGPWYFSWALAATAVLSGIVWLRVRNRAVQIPYGPFIVLPGLVLLGLRAFSQPY